MKKIKALRRRGQAGAQGQGLVEFALVLPLLILLILGIAEMGFALYNYLTLATANREGVRLASRARYDDETVAELVVNSSGLIEQPDGSFRPNMVLEGDDANLGVIITHISVSPEGVLLDIDTFVSGVINGADNVPRPITPADTMFTTDELDELVQNSLDSTSTINAYRQGMLFNTMNNEVIVLETFLSHRLFSPILLPLMNETITLHFHSVMRVMSDARNPQVGP